MLRLLVLETQANRLSDAASRASFAELVRAQRECDGVKRGLTAVVNLPHARRARNAFVLVHKRPVYTFELCVNCSQRDPPKS